MKSTISFIIIALIISFFVALPTPSVQAQGSYTPLAPLPGTGIATNNNNSVNLQSYVPGIVKLAIGIAGALAVIMIVIGGVQYLSTDAMSGKEEGRGKINNAIIGLLLAIGAFVILNTINPDTLKLKLSLQPITTGTVSAPTTSVSPTPGAPNGGSVTTATCPSNGGGTQSCTCNSCANETGLLPFKQTNTNTTLNVTLASALTTINSAMPSGSWQITEAWPPTVGHLDSCHYNGTCVDLNIIPAFQQGTTPSPNQVTIFNSMYQAILNSGLTKFVLEVDQTDFNALVNAGMNANIPHQIYTTTTAPSFHASL